MNQVREKSILLNWDRISRLYYHQQWDKHKFRKDQSHI